MTTPPPDVDAYLADQPEATRAVLRRIRGLVHEVAPGCEETISYGMPTFTVDGRVLLHLAGWKKHVAIYPTPDGDGPVQRQLVPLSSGRGSTRFTLTDPDDMPYDLIRATIALLAEQHPAPSA